MPSADEIGARVRTFRKRRGLSLEVASGLAGISIAQLSRLERGERRFNRRGLIEDLARALSCSVVDLTGQPYAPADERSAMAMAAIPEIELALLDCTLDDVPDLPPRPVGKLATAAQVANEHRAAVRYDLAGRGLGQLMTELHVVAATGSGADREMALRALVEACMAAKATAKAMGHMALAVQADERGLDAARRLGDPALIGFTSMYRALTLMDAGARRRATKALVEVIDSLAMFDPTADTLAADAYGFAHLAQAQLAARSGQAGAAQDHLAEAARTAFRTGERNGLMMFFGPTNVAVWRVAIGVDLQEAGKVYEQATAAKINAAALSTGRVGALHVNLARALAQEGGRRDGDAIRHLDLADQASPQRIRHDPIARELLAELDMRTHGKSWLLSSLRHRFGLTAPTG
jgi:transcriptional regulator with XRE-family HTH domain